jgi:hypothetical protein
MITELRIPAQIRTRGFIFTLGEIYIAVHNLDGDLMAILHVLSDNGHRIVRTQEEFEAEVAFWLNENLPHND